MINLGFFLRFFVNQTPGLQNLERCDLIVDAETDWKPVQFL